MTTGPTTGLAGVVLAAGSGSRLRPLTDLLPKALVPVGGVPLLDGALARLAGAVGAGPEHLAVNAHAHADRVAAAVGSRAHLSREDSPDGTAEALGTAGALGALRGWLAGRSVLVTNADVWVRDGSAATAALLAGWDGERCRLLCEPAAAGVRADFRTADGTGVRYLGSCLLPAGLVAPLEPVPSGLYEVLWRGLDAAGALDLAVVEPGGSVDCGTPADYLRANLAATGGGSAVSPGAVVEGRVERCVVWSGAVVEAHEHLVEVVRAGTAASPVTVDASGASSAAGPLAARRGRPNLQA